MDNAKENSKSISQENAVENNMLKNLKIKNLEFDGNVLLAPMAGVTDKAFRIITKPFGPALMYTEMVSGKGLFYKSKKTADLLSAEDCEKPVAVQIFGHEPDIMAEIANASLSYGASLIDINMGCPAPKIVNNGDGSALMKTPKLAGEVIKAVCNAVSVPVTVKIRAGWDEDSINAVEMAKIAEENGASAITVHGRTRKQFYSGYSDLEVIKNVKKTVDIPVIGNGDIKDCDSAQRMLEYTNCDGIMIGRASEGNPWLFKQIRHYLSTGIKLPPPSVEEILNTSLKHLDLLLKYKGDVRGVLEGRRHMSGYFKGIKGGALLRAEINKVKDPDKMRELICEFCNNLNKVQE